MIYSYCYIFAALCKPDTEFHKMDEPCSFHLTTEKFLSELSDCTGAAVYENFLVFACDRKKTILIFDSQRNESNIIDVSFGHPHDVAIYDEKLYVTMPDHSSMHVFGLRSRKPEREIRVERHCFSITCTKGTCVLVHSAHGLLFIDLEKKQN